MQNGTESDMSFHPASNGLIPLREKTVPASPADVIFAGAERADMKLAAEAETEVFRNDEGGVSVIQSCAATGDANLVYFASTDRVRAVANEMLRLAEVIDAGDTGKEI